MSGKLKRSRKPVTKPKEKRKRTSWEVSSYRLIDCFSACWELVKYEINFLVSLFHVVSNEDSIYHYPQVPIGSDSWCKYNAGRANL